MQEIGIGWLIQSVVFFDYLGLKISPQMQGAHTPVVNGYVEGKKLIRRAAKKANA